MFKRVLFLFSFVLVSHLTAFAGIKLPPVGNDGIQNDNWSCGPCLATRVMQYYGENCTYPKVKEICPCTLKGVIGPFPQMLADFMSQQSDMQFKALSKQSMDDLIAEIWQEKPVIIMIKVGSVPFLGTPLLHYNVITDYDADKMVFTYVDSDGGEYTISFSNLEKRWQFGLGYLGVADGGMMIVPTERKSVQIKAKELEESKGQNKKSESAPSSTPSVDELD